MPESEAVLVGGDRLLVRLYDGLRDSVTEAEGSESVMVKDTVPEVVRDGVGVVVWLQVVVHDPERDWERKVWLKVRGRGGERVKLPVNV